MEKVKEVLRVLFYVVLGGCIALGYHIAYTNYIDQLHF